MSDVINKTTLQQLSSVSTPAYPTADWIHNPDLSALSSVPKKYWKISGETVVEMDAGEKAAVDAAALPGILQSAIDAAMRFGHDLMTEYGASNVLAGRSTAQVKAIADHLNTIQSYLLSGSLYVALDEIENNTTTLTVDSVELVSQATIDDFATKIRDYLGI